MDKHRIQEVIDALLDNELALSKLYAAFSDCFSDDQAFWLEIGKEEQKHIGWITQLKHSMIAGTIETGNLTVRPEAVKSMTSYINTVAEKSKKKLIERINAFTIAKDIEHSMLENRYFEIFNFSNSPHKNLYEAIVSETKKHKDKITKAFEKIKRSKPR
jgi:hypothetical protein